MLARTYVVPVLGDVTLQQLTAPQLQAFDGHLLTAGRVKADLGPAMFEAWRRGHDEGKEPTARQVAAAAGATIHVVRKALPRFRSRWVPPGRTPGLEPKTVGNVHEMLHKALTDTVAWGYRRSTFRPTP